MLITDTQIERWLREDLGMNDVNNKISGSTTGQVVVKESGTIAGVDVATAVFEYLDADVTQHVSDGDVVDEGDVVMTVEGVISSLLRAERVALNLLGHASGIATKTSKAVCRAREHNPDITIAATRKTTPGLREIEKHAVVAGGGDTHRLNLSHMVMVKENHISEMGLEHAVEHFQERTSFTTKIEVETETYEEALIAADTSADIILLDNFSPNEIERVVEDTDPSVILEASGGITVETVDEYANTGVDVISMGSLTHSVNSLDVSFYTGDIPAEL